MNKRIKLRRKRLFRTYRVGQTIRMYQSWFCHNDIVSDWYHEGVVEKIEPAPVRGFDIHIRITKICCGGTVFPESWQIGTGYHFRNDTSFAFVLQDPVQETLSLVTGKSLWACK